MLKGKGNTAFVTACLALWSGGAALPWHGNFCLSSRADKVMDLFCDWKPPVTTVRHPCTHYGQLCRCGQHTTDVQIIRVSTAVFVLSFLLFLLGNSV